MTVMIKNFVRNCVFALTATATFQAHAAAVNLTTPGLLYGGSQYTLGFKFTVDSAVSITSLGVFDDEGNGLGARAQVGLWDTSGNLLTSAFVGAGLAGDLEGVFRYADISPYALVAGTEYVIGSYTTDLASSLGTGQGGTGSVDSLVNIIEDRFSNFNSAFSFADTTNSNAGGAWLGANFRYEAVSVPEPTSLALAGLSLFALAAFRRQRRV